MSADTSREEALFDAAIQIPDPRARTAFLEEACGGDATVRDAVEALLNFHDTADDLLDRPVIVRPPTREEPPGTVLGRYRINERLGEGGFGIVYGAEQLEPVQRAVAVKVIKPGLGGAEALARFDTERQSLAMMSHPNIATVLDAGTTESGQPYFVMELVTGQPLDAYCDSCRLPIADRLRLLIQVCRAVQHAHHKGIVHRDLKPSNVLVSIDDGRSVPKVIDFGLAKAVDRSGLIAVTGDQRSLLGTPEYMSPEQVTGGDVDARADIYALGGMLNKLLTGFSPLASGTGSLPDVAAILPAITEVDPPRPSLRVQELGEASHAVAASRATRPELLARALRGDLDWIVLKALDKAPSRRYATASELALDMERYLEHQPVSAGPPRAAYLVKKFIRRHRVSVVAGALVAVALTLGGALSLAGFVQARREWHTSERLRIEAEMQRGRADQQRAVAIDERDKARQVADLLHELVGATHPESGRPADFTVLALLDSFAASLDGRLSNQPDVEAMVRRAMGRTYWSLGRMSEAGPHLERALALRRPLWGDSHLLVAQSQVDFALYLLQTSRLDDAEQAVRKSLVTLRDAGPSEELVWALYVLARIRYEFGEIDDGNQQAREAWSIAREVHGGEHSLALQMQGFVALRASGAEGVQLARDALARLEEIRPEPLISLAQLKRTLASILAGRSEFLEAERLAREALDIDRKLLGPDSSYAVQDLLTLGETLSQAGRAGEAELAVRDAVAIAERVSVERDLLRARAYRLLATMAGQRDATTESEALQQAIETSRRVVGERPEVGRLLSRQGMALLVAGKYTESIQSLRDALTILRDRPDQLEEAGLAHSLLAAALRETGEFDEALIQFREAATIAQAGDGKLAFVYITFVTLLTETGQLEEAERCGRELSALTDRTGHHIAQLSLPIIEGLLQMARGDYARAERTLYAAAEPLRGNIALLRSRTRVNLARSRCLIMLERFSDAETLLLQVDQRIRSRPAMGPLDSRALAQGMVFLYETWNKPERAQPWREAAR